MSLSGSMVNWLCSSVRTLQRKCDFLENELMISKKKWSSRVSHPNTAIAISLYDALIGASQNEDCSESVARRVPADQEDEKEEEIEINWVFQEECTKIDDVDPWFRLQKLMEEILNELQANGVFEQIDLQLRERWFQNHPCVDEHETLKWSLSDSDAPWNRKEPEVWLQSFPNFMAHIVKVPARSVKLCLDFNKPKLHHQFACREDWLEEKCRIMPLQYIEAAQKYAKLMEMNDLNETLSVIHDFTTSEVLSGEDTEAGYIEFLEFLHEKSRLTGHG